MYSFACREQTIKELKKIEIKRENLSWYGWEKILKDLSQMEELPLETDPYFS
jgi:hypothetical protein